MKKIFVFIIIVLINGCDIDSVEDSYIELGQNFYEKHEGLININKKKLKVIRIEDIPEAKNLDLSSAENFVVDLTWSCEESIFNVYKFKQSYVFLAFDTGIIDYFEKSPERLKSKLSLGLCESIKQTIGYSNFSFDLNVYALLSDNNIPPIFMIVSVKDKNTLGAYSLEDFEIVKYQDEIFAFSDLTIYPETDNREYDDVISYYLYLKRLYQEYSPNIEFLGFDIINILDNCPNYITEPCDLRDFVAPITYKL